MVPKLLGPCSRRRSCLPPPIAAGGTTLAMPHVHLGLDLKTVAPLVSTWKAVAAGAIHTWQRKVRRACTGRHDRNQHSGSPAAEGVMSATAAVLGESRALAKSDKSNYSIGSPGTHRLPASAACEYSRDLSHSAAASLITE